MQEARGGGQEGREGRCHSFGRRDGWVPVVMRKGSVWGAWVARMVQRLTFDFGSGHDVRVKRSGPMLGSTLKTESTSPSPSVPPHFPALSLSLK